MTQAGVMALLLASMLLGVLRDLLVAGVYGGGALADLLFLALVVPVLCENLFGIALRDGAIPFLQAARRGGPAPYRDAARRLYRGTLLAGIVAGASVAVAAPLLLRLLVPGWSAAERASAQPAFALGGLLIAVQTVLYLQTALLNGEGRFVLPSARSVVFNLAAIGVLALAGAPFQVLLAMALAQAGWALLLHLPLRRLLAGERAARGPSLRAFLGGSMLPLVAVALAQQLAVVAERMFASELEPGSITLLSLAWRLVTVPQTLFALGVLALIYPALARSHHAGDRAALAAEVRRGTALALLFTVPAALVCWTVPEPLLAVLLQRGAFTAADVARLAPLVSAYAWGLPCFCLALVWGRVLLTLGARAMLLAASALGLLLTLAADLAWVGPRGAAGLASALSLGAALQAGLLGAHVARRLPGALPPSVFLPWGIGAAAGLAAARWLGPTDGALDLVGTLAAITLALALGVATGGRALLADLRPRRPSPVAG